MTVATFDGTTFDPALDGPRLVRQLAYVFAFMSDGTWRTLREIEEATGFPQASISARLRDLRKPKYGAHAIERRRRGVGLHEYRLVLPVREGGDAIDLTHTTDHRDTAAERMESGGSAAPGSLRA